MGLLVVRCQADHTGKVNQAFERFLFPRYWSVRWALTGWAGLILLAVSLVHWCREHSRCENQLAVRWISILAVCWSIMFPLFWLRDVLAGKVDEADQGRGD